MDSWAQRPILLWFDCAHHSPALELNRFVRSCVDEFAMDGRAHTRIVARRAKPDRRKIDNRRARVELESHARLRVAQVYPPCDTSGLARLPFDPRLDVVLSIAQFRLFIFFIIFDN